VELSVDERVFNPRAILTRNSGEIRPNLLSNRIMAKDLSPRASK
jgi:hypothetical protein